MKLDKGDVCLVNFNPAEAKQVDKFRPAIILSDREDNEILKTVIVIPLSENIIKNSKPYRFTIKKSGKLEQDLDACIYEVRALSKKRISGQLTKLTKTELKEVQAALCQIIN